jgi:hypothetical protein
MKKNCLSKKFFYDNLDRNYDLDENFSYLINFIKILRKLVR